MAKFSERHANTAIQHHNEVFALRQQIVAIQQERDRLACALNEITTACEEDCGVPSADDGDNEPVAATQAEHGPIKGSALTFGMLRRARRALSESQREKQEGGEDE